MSSLLYRIARVCYRAGWRVVAVWVAIVVALGGLTLVSGGSFDDDFVIPGASSQVALDQLRMTFPEAAEASASMVVLAPEGGTVDDAVVRDAMEAEAERLEELDWVSAVQLPHNEYIEGLISDDRTAALLNVRVKEYSVSTFPDDLREVLNEHGESLEAAIPGSEVHVGGDLFSMSLPHLSPIEAIGVGVAIVVLVLVLGSFRAAMMPLVSALVGAAISLMLVVISSAIITINSTTTMLALMLALAVGIDYSLFIVSRHRDQLATGMDAEESAARATGTAGSAVVFAGLTVIVALVGLGVAQLPFLTIMGVYAALAVAIEVLLAITLLPAMLGLAGEKLRPKASDKPARFGERGPSHWWVNVVTGKPVITIVVVVAILGALTIPMKDLQLALPNSGRNPPGAQDRVTFDLISERFGVGYNGPLVITGSIVESTDPMGLLDDLRADIEGMPGVRMVAAALPNLNADTAMIQIIPETGPDDPATAQLVEDLRARAPEWEAEHGITTSVTGFTAAAIDVSSRLAQSMLPFGLFVVGLSLVLLAMVFRSIWVPLKAALGYMLSVGAAFGITALMFNQGIGKELINLPEPVPVISFFPIILMGILFGLAMDYEVFLVSRMREEHVHGNTVNPTEEGFVHSAKVVVAAALIMIAVFAFFVPAGEGVIKPIAFGLALGVAIDAFLIRMTLGPAVMKLLGERAWWLPQWLADRLPVMDIEGESLAHELSLADWPAQGAPQSIYGEGLGAEADGTVLFHDLDVDVLPGHSLVVSGPVKARTALLLALSGRLALSAGELKVLGLVLPQQAGAVRARSVVVDVHARDVEHFLGGPLADLIVVPDADQLHGPARDALAALADNLGERTLVLGVPDPRSVADVVPPSASDLAAAPPEGTYLPTEDLTPVGSGLS